MTVRICVALNKIFEIEKCNSVAQPLAKTFSVYKAAVEAMDASRDYAASGVKDEVATKGFATARKQFEQALDSLFDDVIDFVTMGNKGYQIMEISFCRV